jgi:hypothetical protein
MNYPYINLYTSEKWVETNCLLWDCKATRIHLGSENAEYGEIILYQKGGKLYHPPINAYDGFSLITTPTKKTYRIQRQKHSIKKLLVQELVKKGCNSFILPPSVSDVRPFTWHKWGAKPRYTYTLKLNNINNHSPAVRKQINKAVKSGYICRKTEDWKGLLSCLHDTEQRQKFSYHLDINKIEIAANVLGTTCFRCYVCYSPNGTPASSRVVIWPGFGVACDWLAGTANDHLNSGATQQLIEYALDDLRKAGCAGFDFCGANIPNVQAQKAEWGGELQVYYHIYRLGIAPIIMDIANLVKSIIQK